MYCIKSLGSHDNRGKKGKDTELLEMLKSVKIYYLITLMYNTKVICIYNSNDIFKDIDNVNIITEKDKEYYQDAYYRDELLSIFGLEEYNDIEISLVISNLYEKIKECKELKECMLKLASKFMSLDEEFGLMMLFAYEYMYISHICISEFLETGQISQVNISKLKSIIFNF